MNTSPSSNLSVGTLLALLDDKREEAAEALNFIGHDRAASRIRDLDRGAAGWIFVWIKALMDERQLISNGCGSSSDSHVEFITKCDAVIEHLCGTSEIAINTIAG